MDASRRLRGRFVPMAAEILYSTSPEQRLDIKRRFDKRNAKYLKPIADMDIAEERERWRRDFKDGFEFFVGKASRAQVERIARVANEFVPEERMWVEYRERWQQDVFTLMDLKLGYPELLLRMREMVGHRERWYGANYNDVMVRNERLYRDVAVDLANSLSERQQQANRKKSKTRARVEHVFGAQEMAPGGRVVCTIGIRRAAAKIGLQNLVYNIRRLVILERMAAA